MILKLGKYRLFVYHQRKNEITEPMAKRILTTFVSIKRAKAMDNKELLWRLINAGCAKNLDTLSREDMLWAELENRLFLDYDGENITYEDWGWKWKDGRRVVYRDQ